MKVIDLLNIPLNELPQKIKVKDETYTLFIDEDTNYHYYLDDKCKYFVFTISYLDKLNEEVEIIEEDKKDKEIEILNNKLNLIKNNIDTITKKEILNIIENYTGFFGKGSE